MHIHKDACARVFIAAWCTTAEEWKPPTCPSADELTHTHVPPHTGTSLSHAKERSPDTRSSVDGP